MSDPSFYIDSNAFGRSSVSSKSVVSTTKAPAAIGPYSQAIVANGLVYTAGVIPLDPETKQIAGDDIRAQAERVLTSLRGLLEDAGSSLDLAVKTTCFLQDLADFPVFNEVYASFFNGDAAPARSTVQVAGLPLGVLVEVECIAMLAD
jgi:2-iminobutanoate/2-iminopropanoate deaminase